MYELKFNCIMGWANKKCSTLIKPKKKLGFLIDAMWFKFRPKLSGVGLDLTSMSHGFSLSLI
jgi:hypothetical protein